MIEAPKKITKMIDRQAIAVVRAAGKASTPYCSAAEDRISRAAS
jgi:hypothetical protein